MHLKTYMHGLHHKSHSLLAKPTSTSNSCLARSTSGPSHSTPLYPVIKHRPNSVVVSNTHHIALQSTSYNTAIRIIKHCSTHHITLQSTSNNTARTHVHGLLLAENTVVHPTILVQFLQVILRGRGQQISRPPGGHAIRACGNGADPRFG